MSFKKFIILIIIIFAVFYFANEEKEFFSKIFDKINFEDMVASLEEKETEKTIRIYNSYPSGESLTLKEDTKLLSKTDGVVYQLEEDVTIPGITDGKPGKAEVKVIIIKKDDTKIDEDSIITVPGLSSTDYFETTWGEVISEEDKKIIEEEEIKKEEEPISTLVSGIIKKDTFWELKNSPYIVSGNIFIPENVTLFIEAGVDVVFEGDFGFLIEGEIRMVGQKINPIKIR
ncbi:MAG: hypothetical protein PHG24_00050 [Candidatus Pacebacteria bacterium]|nr:hypothetical protein [Candidatus Paceibacterota bacterium]